MGAEAFRPQAIYSSRNVKVAYQLDWSLTLFWRTPSGQTIGFRNYRSRLNLIGSGYSNTGSRNRGSACF